MKLGLLSPAHKQMRAITEEIIRIDPKFREIITSSKLCDIGLKKNKDPYFKTLVQSIISQQLATKASQTISSRLESIIDSKFEPEVFLNLSRSDLKNIGISGAKARAITELSLATVEKRIDFNSFAQLPNEAINEQLMQIWGIGRWTCEMFLIFHLSRLNVWPVGDLAVRRGWMKIHDMRSEITPEKLKVKGVKFAGFQSVVAWYCWQSIDK
jgi:DNA-3-methyladenine glycosylase II